MVVLTIAGSDPDGGAGIQADLRTFEAFGLHGTSAITCVTAQNTKKLISSFYLPESAVKDQLDAIFSDFKVEAVKIGLLGKKEIVETVANELKRHRAKNIVLDPIITTQADRKLLIEKDSLSPLVQILFPISTLITPNHEEAKIISGIDVVDLKSAEEASKIFLSLGAKNTIIKGIKAQDKIHDLFYSRNKKKVFTKPISKGGTHGGGCVFSSAIAANLALGKSILDSIDSAEEFINNAIVSKKKPGKGIELVDPLAKLHKESERYTILKAVKNALELIESKSKFGSLIPEVGSNIGYALQDAKDLNDVAVVVGRIRHVLGKAKSFGIVDFGASSHVARMILKMVEFDKEKRSAMNIRYSEKTLEKLRKLGLRISFYDREAEPAEIKETEGATMAWGIEQAVKHSKKIPDVVYHKGAVGKEPQIVIFGKDPSSVVGTLEKL